MAEKIHETIHLSRRARRFTLNDVALKIKCTAQYISEIETGKRPISPGRLLESICALYSLDYPAVCHALLDEKLAKQAIEMKKETSLFEETPRRAGTCQ